MTQIQEMAAKIRHAYDQFPKGDVETFARLFGDSAVMIEADSLPYGGSHKGYEGVKAALIDIVTKWFSEISFDIRDFLIGENHVAAYGRLTAVSKTSGEKINFPLAEVWHIENGKVLSMTPIYFDTSATAYILR
ncbi:nuclear transport factor 2 family protein [Sphingomonadaceae bacterium G21617-S1]|nr:nuclear transport factor 2 family protein [Sphingomonadaceae bacterium G21617-S1]